jgi:hypothetical protein
MGAPLYPALQNLLGRSKKPLHIDQKSSAAINHRLDSYIFQHPKHQQRAKLLMRKLFFYTSILTPLTFFSLNTYSENIHEENKDQYISLTTEFKIRERKVYYIGRSCSGDLYSKWQKRNQDDLSKLATANKTLYKYILAKNGSDGALTFVIDQNDTVAKKTSGFSKTFSKKSKNKKEILCSTYSDEIASGKWDASSMTPVNYKLLIEE